jgi:hypothetical protein
MPQFPYVCFYATVTTFHIGGSDFKNVNKNIRQLGMHVSMPPWYYIGGHSRHICIFSPFPAGAEHQQVNGQFLIALSQRLYPLFPQGPTGDWSYSKLRPPTSIGPILWRSFAVTKEGQKSDFQHGPIEHNIYRSGHFDILNTHTHTNTFKVILVITGFKVRFST